MRTKIFILIGIIVISFAVGRYTVPEKIVTVTKVVEVEKQRKSTKSDTSKETHKKTTVVEIIHPDGTKETRTITEEDSSIDKKKSSETESERDRAENTSKEVTSSSSKVTISALGGVRIFGDTTGVNPLMYGVSVSKPVLGPITIGVWGLSIGVAGVSVGLTF